MAWESFRVRRRGDSHRGVRIEMGDRATQDAEVHVVPIYAASDLVEQRDGQTSSEMFAKFFEAGEQSVIGEQRMTDGESEPRHDVDDSIELRLVEATDEVRVGRVEADANRDRFPMGQAKIAHRFEAMCCPVAEIEGPCFEPFKRVSARSDVLEMHFGASPDDRPGGIHVSISDEVGSVGDGVEKRGVLKTGDFDRFAKSIPPMAVVKRFEHRFVANHGHGHVEGTDEVLLLESIHAVLHTDRRIKLCEDGACEANDSNAAMGGTGGKSGRVEDRTTAEDGHVGPTVDPMFLDRGEDSIDDGGIVLARLTARHQENLPEFWKTRIAESFRKRSLEIRLCVGQSLVDDGDHS